MVARSTTIGGDRKTSGSHKRSIVDQSWNSATDSVGRHMGSDQNPRNISTFDSVSEQPIGGTTSCTTNRATAYDLE